MTYKKTNLLTEGNIYKSLLTFSIPFLIANFIQILYGAVDLAVVGWFSNQISVSAVSIGSQITQLIVSLITGLTMGGTVLIAQYIGAKRESDSEETIATTFTLFLYVGIILTIIMLLATPLILKLIQTPQASFKDACEYVYICSAGILFIFGYNAVSAILRGMGDAKSPVLFIGVACICNIVLDFILVGPLKMGAAGAAIATVIAQGVSLFLSIRFLRKKDFVFDFHLSSFKLNRTKAIMIFKIGLPVSLQETISSISFLCIASIVNSFGVAASAAYGICTKFEGFAMLPSIALSSAISTVAAQNIGAGKWERAKKAMWISILFSICASMIFFIWAGVSSESIMALFKADKTVTIAGTQYLHYFKYDFLLVAFGFTMNGFFNGCGRTFFAMINGIAASIFIRIPLAFIFSQLHDKDLTGIGAAIPLATLVSVIAAIIYYQMGKWKKTNLDKNL
ncbi:MAG: MATE family efflux transporter [Longicatena sp.]